MKKDKQPCGFNLIHPIAEEFILPGINLKEGI